MNRRETSLMVCMLGGILLAGMTACSRDDDEATKAPDSSTMVPDNSVKVRRLTITEKDNGAAARQTLTRATLTTLTEDNGLAASWRAGDGLSYCNLSFPWEETGYAEPVSGSLTAVSTAVTSQFSGDVECSVGDYLAVVYPATSFETNECYTISLKEQDGTLSKIASTYHYVYGRAKITKVTSLTAEAEMPKMKSLLTVCKFSFVDGSTSSVIPVKTLSISYGSNDSNEGKYPQTATVSISDNMEQEDVHATGDESTGPLSISCETAQEAVYVALLPTGGQRTFNFTVTNGSGTYTGTARASLKEGEYVVASLVLTKQ